MLLVLLFSVPLESNPIVPPIGVKVRNKKLGIMTDQDGARNFVRESFKIKIIDSESERGVEKG